jgi:hypothetical protein
MGCNSPQNAGVPSISAGHLNRVSQFFYLVASNSSDKSFVECE